MHLSLKLDIPRCALSISRLFRRPLSSQRIFRSFREELSAFQEDVKAIDPKVLATAMGGIDEPPEESVFSTFEEGFGYFIGAAVGRSLKQYEFVRKVRMCELPCLDPVLIIEFSWVGLVPPLCGSRCELLMNSH
jgi:serine/threonine-protein kinase SRPK3